jgi:hypothetical protein
MKQSTLKVHPMLDLCSRTSDDQSCLGPYGGGYLMYIGNTRLASPQATFGRRASHLHRPLMLSSREALRKRSGIHEDCEPPVLLGSPRSRADDHSGGSKRTTGVEAPDKT